MYDIYTKTIHNITDLIPYHEVSLQIRINIVTGNKRRGLESGGAGFFHPDPDRRSLDRNPSRSRSRQNIFSGFSMPLLLSVNTIHRDFESIKVFARDFVAPIPLLTVIPVPIPPRREKSRDFDPDPFGIGTGFGKKIGIGAAPPDSIEDYPNYQPLLCTVPMYITKKEI